MGWWEVAGLTEEAGELAEQRETRLAEDEPSSSRPVALGPADMGQISTLPFTARSV